MYLEEITQLTNFISTSRRSVDDLCKHLVVNTFRSFSPRAIYVGQVDNGGHLVLKASFGFSVSYIEQFRRLPLTLNVPVIEAVRSEEIIHIESRDSFFEEYPDLKSLGTVDEDWNSAIAVPFQSIGAYFIVLHGSAEMNSNLKCFLRIIAHLISISLDEPIPVFKSRDDQTTKVKNLTPRQEIIKLLLAKGHTNAHIATEIGYSESLVRQETIAIYAALKISGREELIRADQYSTTTA